MRTSTISIAGNPIVEALQRGARLIIIKGLRRTGKTSLFKTCLEEAKIPYLLIDGRRFAHSPTSQE